jgi:hypothetical protein
VKYIVCLLSLLFTLLLFSCKRNSDKITTDPSAKLSFSETEIIFDTIFSSVGSVTRRLWVYNENSHALKISTIQLGKLYSSSYTLILDGEERHELNDYEIKGKDSMLVMVKVLINPHNQSLPYLVEDSIVFTTNGNVQDVDLMAYGQDAFFLSNTTVGCADVWTNTKPYVIYGNVIVPAGCTLTIDEGTRVRFHQDATLTVAGTLITQGTKDSIVTFSHDNLSNYYAEIPGQWGGIIFKKNSTNNYLLYTEIKNAVHGIRISTSSDADTIAELKIENTVVKNCSKNGIDAINSDVYAINSLISNCAGYLFHSASGGNYYFDFCTFANYSYDFFRNAPDFRLSNRDITGANPLFARLRNTIIWGDKADEIELNDNGVSGFIFNADYSILRTSFTSSNISGINTLFNQDPLFADEYNKKFNLQSSSPAVDSGITLPLITDDLPGKTRDANPDLGCYEN